MTHIRSGPMRGALNEELRMDRGLRGLERGPICGTTLGDDR